MTTYASKKRFPYLHTIHKSNITCLTVVLKKKKIMNYCICTPVDQFLMNHDSHECLVDRWNVMQLLSASLLFKNYHSNKHIISDSFPFVHSAVIKIIRKWICVSLHTQPPSQRLCIQPHLSIPLCYSAERKSETNEQMLVFPLSFDGPSRAGIWP